LEFDQLKGNTNTEETGKWVLLRHRNYEPMDVYGFFNSEKEAIDYGMKYGFDQMGDAMEAHMVLNAHYQYKWRREPWE
jgi:hypothetical protein